MWLLIYGFIAGLSFLDLFDTALPVGLRLVTWFFFRTWLGGYLLGALSCVAAWSYYSSYTQLI